MATKTPSHSITPVAPIQPKAAPQPPELINPPSREVACEIIEGSSPAEIAEKLADKIIAEKVL